MIARERVVASGSITAHEGTSVRDRAWEPLTAILALLPVVALVELLLMRVFYRVGIFIPKQGPFRDIYAGLTAVGSFSLNLSSVLVAVALWMLAVQGIRGQGRTAGVALVGFLVAAGLARLAGIEVLGPAPRLAFGLAVLALTVPFVRGSAHPLHRAMVAAVGACFLLSAYAGVTAESARLAGIQLPWGVGAQLVAEALAVATAILAAVAWIATDGGRWGPIVLGAPLAATVLAAWYANGAITGILVLWTEGFRLVLPVWLYALALWCLLSATIGWLPRHAWRSGGLVLLLASGMLLGNTYLQALGLVALALLTDGLALGGLPRARGAAVST